MVLLPMPNIAIISVKEQTFAERNSQFSGVTRLSQRKLITKWSEKLAIHEQRLKQT